MSKPRSHPAGRSAGKVRVGISGWRYAPWRGVFYPPGLPQREELAFAARHFATLEINGTFYSLQRPAHFAAWRNAVPEDFVFSVKAPRYITHVLRLKDMAVPLANFLASGLFELGPKLGPILWQFPPQLPFLPERFEPFLASLPHDTGAASALARGHDARMRGRVALDVDAVRPLRHAVEVRHASFKDPAFISLLRRHRVALVVADTAGRWPLMEDLTADFVYLRLHGDQELYASGYAPAALQDWARRIATWRDGGQVPDARLAGTGAAPRAAHRDIYAYFDNDVKVHAPFDAADLARRLGRDSPLGPRPADLPEAPPVRRRMPALRSAADRAAG